MKKFFSALSILLSAASMVHAQDTLPRFSVENIGNKRIVVSWTNPHTLVKQINVQRSFDSVKSYTTILNVADPNAPENGYADATAPNTNMFYRLFVVLDKGEFYFTAAKKPIIDSTRKPDMSKIATKKLVDSLNQPSVFNGNSNKPVTFIPSLYVFTLKDGFLHVRLPGAPAKKYTLKFYDEDENFLFELKDIKQPKMTLEKSNFYHAGWFRFELFENNVLLEKHRFYLSRDF